MQRLSALLVTVIGCGRVAFDPAQDAEAVDEPRDALVCPAGYTAAGRSCYRFMEVPWLTVEQACEADGAHLVVVDDEAELAVLAPLHSAAEYWIGATDRITEGTYLAVTGGAPYLRWSTSEPTGTTAENCVRYNELSGMNDGICTDIDDAFCEFDGRPADPAAF